MSHLNSVDTEDVIKVLQGHIKDGYMFNPTSPASVGDRGYNKSPILKDRIHCLVSVIPANRISMMEDGVIDKMRKVRAAADHQGIPYVVILTKVDDTCCEVSKDITHVYRSKKIRDKMQECSNRLGVAMNCIFPVKCYHEEIDLNEGVDVLLLSALTFILNFANDHVAVMASSPNVCTKDHIAKMVSTAAKMTGSSRPHYVNISDDNDDNQQPLPIPPGLPPNVSTNDHVRVMATPSGAYAKDQKVAERPLTSVRGRRMSAINHPLKLSDSQQQTSSIYPDLGKYIHT